jgi:ribonuclease III family protein
MSDNIADTDTGFHIDTDRLSPVVLAFMGDAVYETLVRGYLIGTMRIPASKLHRACVGFVKASAQAGAVRKILPLLTDEERTILRRGRNANTTHVPKNSAPSDYRYATGLEALFGYLYFCGRSERISEIFDIIAQSNDVAADGGH